MAMIDSTDLSAEQWEAYGCSVGGAGTYAEGDTATLTAYDSYPVYFHGWYAGGVLLSNDYTFSFAVTADTMFTAVYAWHQGISPLSTLHSPLALYPNPASSTVNVETAEAGEAVVYSVAGMEVKRLTINAGCNQIDVADLPQGVYFVRLGTAHSRLQVVR